MTTYPEHCMLSSPNYTQQSRHNTTFSETPAHELTHRVRHLFSLHINPWPLTAQISFIRHWFGQAALHLARRHAKSITVSLLLTVSLHVDHQGRVIVMRRNLRILIRACTTSALIYGPVLQSQRLHLWLEGVSQCVKLTTMVRPP